MVKGVWVLITTVHIPLDSYIISVSETPWPQKCGNKNELKVTTLASTIDYGECTIYASTLKLHVE